MSTNKNKFSTKRLCTLAVLTAMALIMFMIENLFPSMLVPGAKMGLSNIFTLLAVIMLSPLEALALVVIRTVLGSLFTNVATLMYSLSAGLVSVVLTAFMVEYVFPKMSILAISIVSAVAHNLTQNLVFCLISQTPQMFSYMPYLALIGVLAGAIVGLAVYYILKIIKMKTFYSVLDYEDSDG